LDENPYIKYMYSSTFDEDQFPKFDEDEFMDLLEKLDEVEDQIETLKETLKK
jgi:tetrahydromethanopterin S-methyltransferase subunit G